MWAEVRPLIIAHRGASAEAPENTVAAFRLARRYRAGLVELDVHQTKDGRLVVIHDATLRRTTGCEATVGHLTLAQLRRLDAGSWFSPRFRGEPIPTLEEALASLGSRMGVNIELKAGRYPGMEGRLIALLDRLGWIERALVSSFHPSQLARVRGVHRSVAIGILVHPWSLSLALARARRYAALSIHPPARVTTAQLVSRIHRNGRLVFPYTVDHQADRARLIRMGIDGYFTNRP